MSPTVNKYLHIAVLVVVAVAGLGPVVATFSGVLPSKYLSAILAVVAFAGTIVTYLAQSPLLSPLLPTRPVVASRVPPSKVPTLPLLAMAACVAVLTLGQGCAWFKANEATLTADGEALAACIVAEALSGDTSAIAIGVKCGAPAGFDVLGFVGKVLAGLTPPRADGAVAAQAPNAARDAVISALRAVH